MILRTAKLLLVCALAFYYTLVVLNNIIDYDSNFQFVRHVLMMDSTFPGNHLIWRAINSPAAHTAFYVSIILWETATMILLWIGSMFLVHLYVVTWPCPKCGRPFRSMLLSLVSLWRGKKCANCGAVFGEN